MKKVLGWLQFNVVAIICSLLALASMYMLYVIDGDGSEFRTKIQQRNNQVKDYDGYMTTPIEIPSEKPDDPPRHLNIAVNEAAIRDIKDVYDRMKTESQGVFNFAIGFNKQNHVPVIDGLFPEPSLGTAKIFAARSRYRQAFSDMFEPYSASSSGHPQLDARPPLSPTELNKSVEKVVSDYLNQFLPPKSISELTPAENDVLNDRKQKAEVMGLLNYARGMHLYARIGSGPGFPFDVGQWAYDSTSPKDEELWEGQIDLWVQQDIARALFYTNLVSAANTNVLNVPVKRLLGMRVVPGYVGLGSVRGGVGTFPDVTGASSSYPSTIYSGGPTAASINESAIENVWSMTPTGRTSNAIYDVKHTYLSMIVDVQRLPEFFDNLAQVNFMTVVQMNVTDIDEYAEGKNNLIYGAGVDCVKVDMVIESIWLRSWTKKMMPAKVKRVLGIPIPGAPAPGTPATPEENSND